MFRAIIVEDEAITRRGLIMTTPWQDWDIEIINESRNGQEGYDAAIQYKPDIVITDIKMPVMNGIEMMMKILEDQETVFLVLSAFSEFEYAQQALKLGAVDYLLKPFTDIQLKNAIEKAKQEVLKLKALKKEKDVTQKEFLNTVDRYLSKSNKSKHENIIKSIQYIQHHYAEEVALKDVTDVLKVSESYLSRLFREETSFSFLEYLTVYRIKKACEILVNPAVKIYEVANKVGYRDQRYFSSVFKKYMGMTPNEFKERIE